MDLFIVPPAQWEIRSPGVIGLVGTEHTTIRINLENSYLYEVWYKDKMVSGGRYIHLLEAQTKAMTLPALLQDFGLDA